MTEDQANTLAEVDARLSITLGRVDDTLALMRRQAARSMAPVVGLRDARSEVVNGGGVLLLDLGGPDKGHYWYVRRLMVGGLSPTIAAAGVADWFTSAADITVEPSLGDWAWRSPAMPDVDTFGPGELVVRNPEHLIVRFSAATVAQAYVAAWAGEDHQEAAGPQEWTR